MNSRRTALRTIGLLTFAALAHAQRRDRPVRIGTMTYQPRTVNFIVAYEQRLRELGYVDGKNMVMDFRTLEKSGESVIDVARSIVAAEPDVILAPGPSETLEAARAATRTIPIVIIAIDYDPLTLGYVQSLARPGGNITGLFLRQIELTAKRLELIREIDPKARRVGMLWDRLCIDQLKEAQNHAGRLKIELVPIELRGEPYDYGGALRAAAGARPEILLVGMSPLFFRDRARLFEATNAERLATVCGQREFVEAGAVLSYGASFSAMYRRAAEYMDRILKGARPGDLPIEQATVFETVVSLKAAHSLGFTVPQVTLLRADTVIE
jgi:putative ABC transport system substrate-binding protein